MIESFFEKWPDPESASSADEDEMRDLVRPLGMFNRRVKSIKKMSQQFLTGFSNAIELYGCGKYANDTHRIFIKGEWAEVQPQDHALKDYHNFLVQLYPDQL